MAARIFRDATGALSVEQFTRNSGSSFASVRDTLVHIMGVEWLWLERWHGRLDAALPSTDGFPDLGSIRKRWAEIDRDLRAFVYGLSAEDLAREQAVRTMKGEPYSLPLWQMMQHLVNHGTYHRGQVTTLLRQMGAAAVGTDLITFYRERASATR